MTTTTTTTAAENISSSDLEQALNIKFDPKFLPYVATSFVFFLILYKCLNPFLSNLLVKNYKTLSKVQKLDWSTRINSSINAITVGAICVYTMIVDRGLEDHPLIYKSYLLQINLSIVIGYLLNDIFVSIKHYKEIGEPFSMAHHFVAVYAFAYVLTLNVMPYFANFRLLAELSTPLVNIRWFLDVLKYSKTSKPYVYNGFLMTFVFFCVRIFAIPVYWWRVYIAATTPLWSHMGHFRYVLLFVCIVLDVINLYWFSKIVRGCIRTVANVLKKKQG